jgi:YhcH/YjgK/YiaL family protein
MILDKISNGHLYAGLGENFKKALEYLKNTDFTNVELGRYEIDGNNLFVLVQEYTAKPIENCSVEAHENYADIQFVVKGREKMGYAPLDTVKVTQAYNPDKDVAKYEGAVDWFVVNEGMFALFLPDDAHEPCLAVAEGETVKKVVAKIRVK